MLATRPPIIDPIIVPIEPYLLPPAFFVPNAAANSSAKVESREMKKRITRIKGVIT